MATVNLGAIRFNWKGAWSNSTAYVVNDVVSNSGNSYICIQANTGQALGNATAYWNIMSTAGTDGTNVATTITTQGDILYRDGSGLQRLAKGTAGQELRINSGATAPEWYTPTVATSDFVKLHSATASNVANLSIDGYFSSTYKRYVLMGRGIRNPSGTDFQWRVNTGGSTNTTSNYIQTNWYSYTDTTPSHGLAAQNVAGGSVDVDSPADVFEFGGDDITDDEDTGCDVTIEIYDPQASNKWKNFSGSIYYVRNDKNTIQNFNQYSVFKSTTALTGITLLMRSGNLYGTFDLYGYKA